MQLLNHVALFFTILFSSYFDKLLKKFVLFFFSNVLVITSSVISHYTSYLYTVSLLALNFYFVIDKSPAIIKHKRTILNFIEVKLFNFKIIEKKISSLLISNRFSEIYGFLIHRFEIKILLTLFLNNLKNKLLIM